MTRLSRLTYSNLLIVAHDLLATTVALFAAFYIRFEGASGFLLLIGAFPLVISRISIWQ